ncbi:hypothetical protein, partial [Saccharibacillus alkalitolerans]|uniref:hypothetical protein n=1 Tax=Saccharibacillus alkalitolerans TaxID=2705290 RepID=UPI00197F7349
LLAKRLFRSLLDLLTHSNRTGALSRPFLEYIMLRQSMQAFFHKKRAEPNLLFNLPLLFLWQAALL